MRALLLAVLPLAAAAETGAPSPVVLLDHGVICDVTIEGRREAPLTESGQINVIDQTREIDVTTSEVPARLGLSFGIRVTLAPGQTVADTRIVVEHPPMGRAGVTVQSWTAPLSPGLPAINLFTFEHDYEMVKGDWRFRVIGPQGVLLEQGFTVTGGLSVPAVQETCFDAMVISGHPPPPARGDAT